MKGVVKQMATVLAALALTANLPAQDTIPWGWNYTKVQKTRCSCSKCNCLPALSLRLQSLSQGNRGVRVGDNKLCICRWLNNVPCYRTAKKRMTARNLGFSIEKWMVEK